RDDEAGAERLRLARGRLTALAAEQVGKRGSGERVGVYRDPLPGGDVDDRRLELLRQISEAFRCAGARDDAADLLIVVLGDLGSGREAGDERDGSPASQQGRGNAVGIAHGLHVLLILFSIRRQDDAACYSPATDSALAG